MKQLEVMTYIAILIVFVTIASWITVEAGRRAYNPIFDTFKLPNGEVVTCAQHSGTACGQHLRDCTNGKEYSCVTNLEKLPE